MVVIVIGAWRGGTRIGFFASLDFLRTIVSVRLWEPNWDRSQIVQRVTASRCSRAEQEIVVNFNERRDGRYEKSERAIRSVLKSHDRRRNRCFLSSNVPTRTVSRTRWTYWNPEPARRTDLSRHFCISCSHPLFSYSLHLLCQRCKKTLMRLSMNITDVCHSPDNLFRWFTNIQLYLNKYLSFLVVFFTSLGCGDKWIILFVSFNATIVVTECERRTEL